MRISKSLERLIFASLKHCKMLTKSFYLNLTHATSKIHAPDLEHEDKSCPTIYRFDCYGKCNIYALIHALHARPTEQRVLRNCALWCTSMHHNFCVRRASSTVKYARTSPRYRIDHWEMHKHVFSLVPMVPRFAWTVITYHMILQYHSECLFKLYRPD